MSKKKEQFICQECGFPFESEDQKHTYVDCGLYHLQRAREILNLAVVAGEDRDRFIQLMIQYNLGQIPSGQAMFEVWKLFAVDILPEWQKVSNAFANPERVKVTKTKSKKS